MGWRSSSLLALEAAPPARPEMKSWRGEGAASGVVVLVASAAVRIVDASGDAASCTDGSVAALAAADKDGSSTRLARTKLKVNAEAVLNISLRSIAAERELLLLLLLCKGVVFVSLLPSCGWAAAVIWVEGARGKVA